MMFPSHDPKRWGQHPTEPHLRVVFRLAIAMGPRMGKSWITTRHTPGWYWSKYPDRKVAVITYSDDFSWEWGDIINTQVTEDNDFLEVKGNRALVREKRFGGEMRFAGVGGKITGTGFHLGVIDDPFKNSEEAMSEATRNSKDNWYGSTMDSGTTATAFSFRNATASDLERWISPPPRTTGPTGPSSGCGISTPIYSSSYWCGLSELVSSLPNIRTG